MADKAEALDNAQWTVVEDALATSRKFVLSAEKSLGRIKRFGPKGSDPRLHSEANRKAEQLFALHFDSQNNVSHVGEIKTRFKKIHKLLFKLSRKDFLVVSDKTADGVIKHGQIGSDKTSRTYAYVIEKDSKIYLAERFFTQASSKLSKAQRDWALTSEGRAELLIHEVAHLALPVWDHPGFKNGGPPALDERPTARLDTYKLRAYSQRRNNPYVIAYYARRAHSQLSGNKLTFH